MNKYSTSTEAIGWRCFLGGGGGGHLAKKNPLFQLRGRMGFLTERISRACVRERRGRWGNLKDSVRAEILRRFFS